MENYDDWMLDDWLTRRRYVVTFNYPAELGLPPADLYFPTLKEAVKCFFGETPSDPDFPEAQSFSSVMLEHNDLRDGAFEEFFFDLDSSRPVRKDFTAFYSKVFPEVEVYLTMGGETSFVSRALNQQPRSES